MATKMIRRLWRPSMAASTIPECAAHTLLSNGKATTAFALATIAIEDAVNAYSRATMELAMARDKGIECEQAWASVAMLATLTNMQAACMPTDPHNVPVHEVLVDQYMQEARDGHLVLKMVAYKLNLQAEKEQDVDLVRVPKDDMSLLLGIVGTFTVRIDGDKMEVVPEGFFAEDKDVMLGVEALKD